ncbi:Uncharacterized protease YrrN [[Clostridium] ultunense Esp]|uniref:peptidase U32 family protein n=1 Tax=Thermicanus aegyptius TaxID=94009 RepID=UPI0002B6F64A|nr:peptidase U32 family protein [Thermicanus aegyptius]CCQ93314.1 Uncharacterized protease YrrN [[Clostridium] ultunense Esp]
MNGNRPEFVIPVGNLDEISPLLSAGADAIIVGESRYALRLPGSMSLREVGEAAERAHRSSKKIYVAMNALLHPGAISELESHVKELSRIGIDGILFGDPAVYLAVMEVSPSIPLQWNTETTSTNYKTASFWAKKGVKRAILAREISQEDVLLIKENVPMEVEAQVHGMTCIFHSKRKLVRNYLAFQKEKGEDVPSHLEHLFLKQDQRDEERYPLFEDEQGTHIMSSEDLCMIDHLRPFLSAGIDAFRFESLFKPLAYNEQILRIYREAVDRLLSDPALEYDPDWMRRIEAIQPKNRPLGTGFYFREQIY